MDLHAYSVSRDLMMCHTDLEHPPSSLDNLTNARFVDPRIVDINHVVGARGLTATVFASEVS